MIIIKRLNIFIDESGDFGFVKGSDGQNPELNKKFVSAYRGKSGIEYGKVYTDEASKTYVSYNYGENKLCN